MHVDRNIIVIIIVKIVFLQWSQSGGICNYALRACSYRSPTPQNNWVLTQYIPYLEARRVFVNVSYRFTQCTNNRNCHNDFVSLSRYDVENKQVLQTDTQNYIEMQVLQQVGRNTVSKHLNFERPENANGFYLGLRDIGTCGQVERIIVYYENAPGYTDDNNLVTCPCIAYPESESDINSKECTCHAHALPVGSLVRTADHSGAVNEMPVCGCKPGYEFANGECQGEFSCMLTLLHVYFRC